MVANHNVMGEMNRAPDRGISADPSMRLNDRTLKYEHPFADR
jgi:hypothetical protein